MAGMRFTDLPTDDALRLKIEARVLEANQNEIWKHLQLLREVQEMWHWWNKFPTARVDIKQKEYVERVLWWKLKQRTEHLNHAISQLYGEPKENDQGVA